MNLIFQQKKRLPFGWQGPCGIVMDHFGSAVMSTSRYQADFECVDIEFLIHESGHGTITIPPITRPAGKERTQYGPQTSQR